MEFGLCEVVRTVRVEEGIIAEAATRIYIFNLGLLM